MTEYAAYKGDDLICIGTSKECADHMGILEKSFLFYLTPTYKNRLAKRKKAKNYITVIKLEGEGEEND